MIFPINVHRRAVNARKLVAQDKTAIIVQLFVIANIGCFFLMKFLFGTFLGLGIGWAILAQLILFTAIGILIFRYIIFKEDEKIQEYNDEQTDSFARYLYVRKDNVTQLSCAEQAIRAFEFTNGCLTTTMLFRFGSNNDAKAKSTYDVLNRMYGLISSYNFKFCTDTMPEVFTNSLEYKRHLAQINNIENKTLSLFLRKVSNEVLNTVDTSCNTDVLYLTITSKIPGEKDSLEQLLTDIIKLLQENVTCFRDVHFLTMDDLLEYYREFYGIQAIDLAMMKAIDLSNELGEEYNKLVHLYSLTAQDGTIYSAPHSMDRYFETKERKI